MEERARAMRILRGTAPLMALLVTLGTVGPVGLAAAEEAGRVTAVKGSASAEGQALGQLDAVPDGAGLRTGADSGASLLLREDAVVELCDNTDVKLKKKKNQRVVEIDGGSMRVMSEPRLGEERIEIQTRVAIATILGTIVNVETDELTGETVITCETEDSLVEITVTDDTIGGERVIQLRGGERLRLKPGEMPKIEKLDPDRRRDFACLDARVLALALDRHGREETKQERYIENDIPDDIDVAKGPETFDPPEIFDPPEGCTTDTCDENNVDPMMDDPPPPPCADFGCGDPGDDGGIPVGGPQT